MPSRTRARLTVVGAAAALALPLTSLPAAHAEEVSPSSLPAVGTAWQEQDPTALSRAVREAAETAVAQRHPSASASARSLDTARPGPRDPGPKHPKHPKDPTARELDAAVRAVVDDGAVAVTARVETPGLRWADAEGVRRLGHRPPAKVDDRFEVASITKPMIATLVMQEVERGTWTLDTRVEDVLPGLLPGHPEVTVEHLLSHRSGMPTGSDWLLAARMTDPSSFDELFEVMTQDYTDADHVAAALATPWLFEPGTDFSYSNSGYVVLGMLLEEATGKDLRHLLKHRVFRPAHMRHSDFPDEPTRGPRLVGAAYTPEGWYSLDDFDPDVFEAAGAVTSTTADLLAFGDALLTGRLLRQGTVLDMATPRSTELLEYGLGVYRVPDPCAAPGSGAYLYGHDGASYGTLSIALTSRDGSRALALGVTGRDLTGDPEGLYDLNELLVPMLLATC